jgi:hypothetical protein
MLSFYVLRIGIISGTLNIEDNIHSKFGLFGWISKTWAGEIFGPKGD